ncbi:MAG: lytic transglycosylase domain-containing protein [Acidobacteria bacterium]|nr:lytic transglycosylase domain-containing protein [Acidobacteriota bacterium]
MQRIVFIFIGFQLAAGLGWAGEFAVLANGFRIPAESHEVRESTVYLRTGQGEIAVPLHQVAKFEQEEFSPLAVPAVAAEAPAQSVKPVNVEELLSAAARKRDIPPELLHSIAQAESGFRADAVSPKGAIGLMQLMPATARAQSADPHDVEQNAEAGANYLAELLRRYENQDYQVEKALAAYNAGPGAVDRYKGIPPYRETQAYVAKVKKNFHQRLKKSSAAARATPRS